jgi:cytochrome oxidase assembly protein ShyY1
MIAPDRDHLMRLVAATPPPGLQPSALPSTAAISNNHRLYAVQWFLFAAIALVIYVLALRKRARARPPA